MDLWLDVGDSHGFQNTNFEHCRFGDRTNTLFHWQVPDRDCVVVNVDASFSECGRIGGARGEEF